MKERALPDSSQTEVDLHLSQGGTRDSSEREWNVVTFESIILPPQSQALTVAKVRNSRATEIPDEILIEPQELGIKGAYVARVICKTLNASDLRVLKGDRTIEKEELIQVDGYVDPRKTERENSAAVRDARYYIMKILNMSLEPLSLGKNIALGLAEEYRDDTSSTCEGETRRILMGSHEPQQAVKVVGSDPPTMAINDNMVLGAPGKPSNNENVVIMTVTPMVSVQPGKPHTIEDLVIGQPVKPQMVMGTPYKTQW
jgi:hypothetical protein